jgi:hypothetical protein
MKMFSVNWWQWRVLFCRIGIVNGVKQSGERTEGRKAVIEAERPTGESDES